MLKRRFSSHPPDSSSCLTNQPRSLLTWQHTEQGTHRKGWKKVHCISTWKNGTKQTSWDFLHPIFLEKVNDEAVADLENTQSLTLATIPKLANTSFSRKAVMGTVAHCALLQTLDNLVETIIKNWDYKEIPSSCQRCDRQKNSVQLLNEMDHWSGLVSQLISGPVTLS